MNTSIVWKSESDTKRDNICPGVYSKLLWESRSGRRAQILEIEPGAKFHELDIHDPGDEEVFVLEGMFNNGVRDYPAGTFIHNPRGSSHFHSPKPAAIFCFFPES